MFLCTVKTWYKNLSVFSFFVTTCQRIKSKLSIDIHTDFRKNLKYLSGIGSQSVTNIFDHIKTIKIRLKIDIRSYRTVKEITRIP